MIEPWDVKKQLYKDHQVFSYESEAKLTIRNKTVLPFPQELRTRIEELFNQMASELHDKVAAIFEDYEKQHAE